MLSALQGSAATTSTINPYAGLQYPRVTSRCTYLRNCFSLLSLKELHQFFPYLLSNIFNFDYSGGWGLRTFSQKLHADFPLVLQFLAPRGDLFQLIAKLEGEGFLYEFPVSCLPRPSQQTLAEGIVPPFYANKVLLSLSVDNAPTHVYLTAFEYYFFHFAYCIIFTQTNQPPSPYAPPSPVSISDSLYTHLLDSYLIHFLPISGTLPLPLTSSPRQGSSFGTTPPGSGQSGPIPNHSPGSLGLLRVTTPTSRCHAHPGMDDSQAEVFVQVLVEFWLNQNTYSAGQGDLLSQAQNQFTPNEEHLLLLRRLLKQVHYFVNGSSHSLSASFLSPLIPITDAFRSSILPLFFQKPVYHFLRHSFRHLPLDTNFRYVLELWLTYCQPWRYTDPSKLSSENKESLEALPKKWRSFVLDNFPFYSSLLMEILGRSFQLDLTSDTGVTLLYRVAKVFSQPGLMSFIEHGESLLLHSDPASHHAPLRSSPISAACSMKALLIDLQGPVLSYQPVLEQSTIEAVDALLDKIGQAKASLSHAHPSPTSPPPPSPDPIPPSPPPTAHPPTAKTSWFKSFWQGLADIFSDDPFPAPHFSTSRPVTDPKRLASLLDATETNLITMFRLAGPRPHPQSPGGSPVLGRAMPILATPIRLHDHSHSATPPRSLSPEYVEGTNRLSPLGKMQLISGLRKCSNIDVRYHGDPVLQPIRSFENAFLVRALYRLSCSLNRRLASQLASIGSSERFLSKLLLQLLAPPPPTLQAAPTTESLPPSTPIGRVSTAVIPPSTTGTLPSISPRINLRTLGSYYTQTYIALGVLLIWLFSIPLWCILLALGLFLCLYCVLGYLGSGRDRKNR